MANYKSKPQVYGEFIAPYDMKLLANAIQLKQQKYDANKAKIDAEIQNLTGIDLLKRSDRDYLQSRMSDLISAVNKGQGVVDFSSNATTEYINRYIGNAVDDTVLTAFQSTSTIRKNREMIDELKRKGSDKYGVSNEHYFNSFVQNYMSNDQVGQSFGAQYIPHFDLQKYQKEQAEFLIKNMGEDIVEYADPNNPWVKVTKKVKELSIDEMTNYIKSTLPQEAKTQLMIDGRYRYRNNPEGLQVDFNNALQSEVKEHEDYIANIQGAYDATQNAQLKSKYKSIITELDGVVEKLKERNATINPTSEFMSSFLEERMYKKGITSAVKASFSSDTTTDLDRAYQAQLKYNLDVFKANKNNSGSSTPNGQVGLNKLTNSIFVPGNTENYEDSDYEYIQKQKSDRGKEIAAFIQKKSSSNSNFKKAYEEKFKEVEKKYSGEVIDKDVLNSEVLIELTKNTVDGEGNIVKHAVLNQGYVTWLLANADYIMTAHEFNKAIREYKRKALDESFINDAAEQTTHWIGDFKIPAASTIRGYQAQQSIDELIPVFKNMKADEIKQYLSGQKTFSTNDKESDQDKIYNNHLKRFRWHYNRIMDNKVNPNLIQKEHEAAMTRYVVEAQNKTYMNKIIGEFNSLYGTNFTLESLGFKYNSVEGVYKTGLVPKTFHPYALKADVGENNKGTLKAMLFNSIEGNYEGTKLKKIMSSSEREIEQILKENIKYRAEEFGLDKKGDMYQKIDSSDKVIVEDITALSINYAEALGKHVAGSLYQNAMKTEGGSFTKSKAFKGNPTRVTLKKEGDFVLVGLYKGTESMFDGRIAIPFSKFYGRTNLHNNKEIKEFIDNFSYRGGVKRYFSNERPSNTNSFNDTAKEARGDISIISGYYPEVPLNIVERYAGVVTTEGFYKEVDIFFPPDKGEELKLKNNFVKYAVENNLVNITYGSDVNDVTDRKYNYRIWKIQGASEIFDYSVGNIDVRTAVMEKDAFGQQMVGRQIMRLLQKDENDGNPETKAIYQLFSTYKKAKENQ